MVPIVGAVMLFVAWVVLAVLTGLLDSPTVNDQIVIGVLLTAAGVWTHTFMSAFRRQ